VTGWTLALEVVQQLVLEEHDRVVVSDSGGEQPFGVGRRRGHDALQAWHVSEDRVVASRVLPGGPETRSDHGADHQWHRRFAAEHVAEFGSLVEDLVHTDPEEVHEHQLGDRPEARGRGAYSRADEGGL